MTCGTCQHFQRFSAEVGHCHRYAPAPQVLVRFKPEFGGNVPAWPNEMTLVWPPVNHQDSCADYQARPESPSLVPDASA